MAGGRLEQGSVGSSHRGELRGGIDVETAVRGVLASSAACGKHWEGGAQAITVLQRPRTEEGQRRPKHETRSRKARARRHAIIDHPRTAIPAVHKPQHATPARKNTIRQ